MPYSFLDGSDRKLFAELGKQRSLKLAQEA